MEQVEVCNSWEEFVDDNAKLLEQRLDKLTLQKNRQDSAHLSSHTPSSSSGSDSEGPPKMRVLKRNVDVPNNNAATNGVTTSSSTNGIIEVTQDESMRTQYVPPEPRISVLSRPKKKNSDDASHSNTAKGKNQAPKTLEQREQEYAEARKRIFGGGDTLET